MHTLKKTAAITLAMATVLSFAGCGAKADLDFMNDFVPATGRVTLEGQPLPGATVRFIPAIGATAGREAMALTDESGAYELSTLVPGLTPDESKGALPGEYVVAISRVAMPDGAAPPPDIVDENDAIAKGAKQFVPSQYTDPSTSPLKATIAAPKAENNFEL